ncbi:MAG: hypothetical protein WC843_02745 [Candidatus Gracilibacteria bacterium]
MSEIKNCKICQKSFEIANEDLEFYDKISPVIKGVKYILPAPVICPKCRMQRLTAFRNERVLYKRKCDFSGKDIISVYPPTFKNPVYDQAVWWSDKWDPLTYGKDFDFNRPFFDQFEELLKKVPSINLQNRNNETSEYCNDTNDLKNCYLCFNSEQAENCHYCNTFGLTSRDCMDMFWCFECELSYECVKVSNSYRSFWSMNSQNLNECFFCDDCQSCTDCFGCVGLRHKQYCIFNEQKTKEEYQEFMKTFVFSNENIKKTKEKVSEISKKIPRLYSHLLASEDCVGDYIMQSKNCKFCFDVMMSEGLKYVWDGMMQNSQDCFNSGMDSTFLYGCVGVYLTNNSKFCIKCSLGCSDLFYSDYCFSSQNLFGCIGLRHKQYCILNRQYSKEQYEELLPKIIEHMKKNGEWGEFYPQQMSPYGYNDTLAQEYFPLSREEAIAKGFNWNDYLKPKIAAQKTFALNDKGTIKEINDDILNSALICEKDGNPYKVISQELELYRKLGVPVPKLCPDCRHYSRKALINPRKLWNRNCAKCGVDLKTTYAPERPEIIYCEKCYLEAVY